MIVSVIKSIMVKTIDVKELKRKIDDKEDFILLDVRTPDEYEEGHIEGSVLIPVNEVLDRHDELEKDKEIVVYCRTDNRSSFAANLLFKLGYKDVSNVKDGILAWEENGYPVSA